MARSRTQLLGSSLVLYACVAVCAAPIAVYAAGSSDALMGPTGLFIVRGSDQAEIDAGALLGAAVREHLPDVALLSGTPQDGDLVVRLMPDAGAWLLVLARADGTVVLSRELAAPHGFASELADACALIIDRFLTDVDWRRRKANSLAVTSETQSVEEEERMPRQPAVWSVSLGGALSMGLNRSDFAYGSILDLQVQTASRLVAGLSVGVDAPKNDEVRGSDPRHGAVTLGTVTLLSGLLLLMTGVCRGDVVSACVMVDAGVSVSASRASGVDLYHTRAVAAAAATGGVTASLRRQLGRLLELRANVSVLGRAPARLEIEGVSGPIYQTATLALIGGISIAARFD